MFKWRIDGSTWAAKASFISTKSMSSIVIPARCNARRHDATGPRPIISGLIPVTADATIRANGVRPNSLARTSLITTIAAAPSLSGHELPAVTEPSGRKAGRSWPSPSRVVSGRGPSSVLITVPSGRVTGVMSRSKNPEAIARAVFCCDSKAKRS